MNRTGPPEWSIKMENTDEEMIYWRKRIAYWPEKVSLSIPSVSTEECIQGVAHEENRANKMLIH